MATKLWMQEAFSKNKGALTAQARKAGALTKSGTIKISWLREQANKGGSRYELYNSANSPAAPDII